MTLQEIQNAVQDDLGAYCTKIRHDQKHLEPGAMQMSDLLVNQLQKDPFYLQAQLVVLGYDICGGTDLASILPIARILQVTHAAALLLAQGEGAASANAQHIAMAQLANVTAPESLRIKALSITHRSMMLHAQGLVATDQESDRTLFCYATEGILNPLHVGMVFTGVGCPETDAITPFAMAWSRSRLTKDAQDAALAQSALDDIDFWSPKKLQNIRLFYSQHA